MTSTKPEYRKVKDYLALPYTIEITRDSAEEGGGWFAKVVELAGCMTQVENLDEVDDMIADAMRAWIETAIAEGISIPEPRARADYSGKFVVRVPRSLHRDLAEAAERDGVSLNSYVNTALAKMVGESRGQYHQA